jgi:threonine dehydrogenase-like Zn-dependent dehydrogenase
MGIVGRNGAMAEYVTLPITNLVPIPDIVSDEKAVFTEPLAAAVEILEQVKIRPSDRTLVIGDGKLGLIISMVLRLIGCGPILVGKHPEKLEIFSCMGGDVISLEDLSQTTERFDIVVEASGSPSGWALAVDRVQPRGKIVLKSTYHGELAFNPAPLVINEITVVGSRCGLFPPAVKLLELGLIDPLPLITEMLSIDDAEKAFQVSGDKDVLKVLLSFRSN